LSNIDGHAAPDGRIAHLPTLAIDTIAGHGCVAFQGPAGWAAHRSKWPIPEESAMSNATTAPTPRPTVAILSPGDMGHAVAAMLCGHGLRVITCLAGRSSRTRALAEQAGVEVVPDDDALVREADHLLSILVPAQAEHLAKRIAAALERTCTDLLYVDCNAIAPQTARRIGQAIEAAGARFVDAGIIGPPPRAGTRTPFYASGEHAKDFAVLRDFGLDVRPIGERPGDASALKMCYAALTKGTTALMTELSVAAERLGVSAALRQEFFASQQAALERMAQGVPAMIPKAHRWVGEMEEIARTFEDCGLTPKTYLGAAEIYDFVAHSSLGNVSPEQWRDSGRPFEQIVAELALTRRSRQEQ
jgi:3-hydroxyisobutyrate dehydrogenase-like beta-hydroxyacid dehydrogenase